MKEEVKTISFKADKEIEKTIKEIGNELMTDNTSHIIRYALKRTNIALKGASNAVR